MTNSVEEIVARVLAELNREGLEPHSTKDAPQESRVSNVGGDLIIDLADPTLDGPRHAIGVDHPADPEGLRNLMNSTSARLGVGRAGPRPKTSTCRWGW